MMMAVRTRRWLALIGALALVLAACGSGRDHSGTAARSGSNGVGSSPGISAREVKLGGIYPFSGPASAYGTIGTALGGYFKYVDEQLGGVKMGDGIKRRIRFVTYDDAYTPANAVTKARQLVEQDKVFALFNTLGTPSNTAIWDYLNAQRVPQVFVATGAGKFGNDVKAHPWTMGWQLAYPTESAIYARYLADTRPDAKVAVLFQNDDYGKDYLDAFKKAVAGTRIRVVAEQSYEVTDPTVDSQVTNLASSGADTFFDITTPKFAAQAIKKAADLSWKPLHLLNSVSSSVTAVIKPAGFDNAQGIVSVAYTKDPSDPQWDDDPAMKRYKSLVARYAPDVDPGNSLGAYGFAVGEALVKTLEATRRPTRASFMAAVRSLRRVQVGLLLPGVTMTTDRTTDGFPIEGGQIIRFQGDRFVLQGNVYRFEGKTPRPGA